MRRLFRSDGLVERLVTAILLAGLVAGVSGAIIIRASAQSALRNEVEGELAGAAQNMAASLDVRVGSLVRTLSLMASRADVGSSDPDPDELAVALRASAEFDELVVYGPTGAALAAASAREVVDAAALPIRPEVVEQVRAGGPSVTVVGDGFPILELAVAVEDPPGHPVGALLGRLPVELVASGLQARFLGPSAVAFVVDGEGRILAHPHRDLVLEGLSYPIDRVSAGDGVMTLERDGEDVLASSAPTASFPGSVVLERDEHEAFERVGEEVTELTVLLVAVLGLAVLAVAVLGTRLVRPLRGLAGTLRRLGEGEQDARVAVSGASDFRTVAEEVNRMADALQRRMVELEAAQRDLRAAEERFRTAFEEAPVPMALASVEGRYERVNAALCELLGRSEQELLGKSWRDITHPDDLERSDQALTDAFRSGARSYQVEKRYVRPDGEAVWVLLSVAFAGGVDRPRYFISHVVDITERRRAEQQAHTLREIRVRQRQAVEVNDNIVQGLTLAKWWFELERLDAAQAAVERTLESARSLINDMIREGTEGDLQPGDLVRERPAEFGS